MEWEVDCGLIDWLEENTIKFFFFIFKVIRQFDHELRLVELFELVILDILEIKLQSK